MMVQTHNFGQYWTRDFGLNFRPILRVVNKKLIDSCFDGDAIRVESARQRANDARVIGNKGKVPGDVFDFPRITGNHHQRRQWHPTQLNEGLVERCLKSGGGGPVLDLFSGTGTTTRVCRRLGYDCLAVEVDKFYCEKIAIDNGIEL